MSAPPGYGKSVLVSQWLARQEHPDAWLSLDDAESDLRLFLAYFLAVIDSVSRGSSGRHAGVVAGAGAPASPGGGRSRDQRRSTPLKPCTIVLDDYHRIAPSSPVHDL